MRSYGSRHFLWALVICASGLSFAWAQSEKKTDDDKPADPDTGESTVQEKTLGLLPQPLQKYGVKFAATYIGEILGNSSGDVRQGAIYEGRLNLAVDVDLQKLAGWDQTRVSCKRLPDTRQGAVARLFAKLLRRQRHRGASNDSAL